MIIPYLINYRIVQLFSAYSFMLVKEDCNTNGQIKSIHTSSLYPKSANGAGENATLRYIQQNDNHNHTLWYICILCAQVGKWFNIMQHVGNISIILKPLPLIMANISYICSIVQHELIIFFLADNRLHRFTLIDWQVETVNSTRVFVLSIVAIAVLVREH